jgi:O-acetyl-ADP-ribose deacetylase (regulator of RNase III)
MEFPVGNAVVELLRGDITEQQVDAIVNAANTKLAGGGGVDGAIHRAGGRSIMEECRGIGGCPTGSAVATGAGKLPARHVIHAVGPVWQGGVRNESALLVSAYRRCLEIANELGLHTIAFPSISTGAYGYPITDAAKIAVTTVRDYLVSATTTLERVRFVLFSETDLSVYQTVARDLLGPGDLTPPAGSPP